MPWICVLCWETYKQKDAIYVKNDAIKDIEKDEI